MEVVRMENIHKRFGRVHAVRGIDFTINEGEIIGLVGDNGAGKSTLIKCLSGLYIPDEGKIFFEGNEVNFKSTKDSMNMGIQTIYQEQALVSTMSIARNMFLGREPTRGPLLLDHAKMEEQSLKILRGMGLNIRAANIMVKNLSGGERQGVAIARAMSFECRVLLLDEPTIMLSVKESQEVLDYVKRMRELGISSVFITHNLHHVYSIADRFVVLSHGQKVGDVRKDDTSVEEISKLIVLGLESQIMDL
jgi:simple sugar transport system ATP-binding protein